MAPPARRPAILTEAKVTDKETKNADGQKAHFEIYKNDLKEFCDWLTYVKNAGPVSPWKRLLCNGCAQYKDSAKQANSLEHDGADIGACAGCTGCP